VKDLREYSIMSYAHGAGGTMKLVTRKRDNPWYVKCYGGMKNDHERPHRLKNRVEFSQSLTVIVVLEQKDATQANAKATLADELGEMAPSARIKLLKNNNDLSKLTKKESVSLLLTWFAVKEDAN
jgi:hypothetical protein